MQLLKLVDWIKEYFFATSLITCLNPLCSALEQRFKLVEFTTVLALVQRSHILCAILAVHLWRSSDLSAMHPTGCQEAITSCFGSAIDCVSHPLARFVVVATATHAVAKLIIRSFSNHSRFHDWKQAAWTTPRPIRRSLLSFVHLRNSIWLGLHLENTRRKPKL